MEAFILASNDKMIKFARQLGFDVRRAMRRPGMMRQRSLLDDTPPGLSAPCPRLAGLAPRFAARLPDRKRDQEGKIRSADWTTRSPAEGIHHPGAPVRRYPPPRSANRP